jgi:hypothetical protein
MAYNAEAALRAVGMVNGPQPPEIEHFYASLTQEETETLISLKSRLDAVLPDVVAHSADWQTPEAAQQGFDAAMMCLCSIWSGGGAKAD